MLAVIIIIKKKELNTLRLNEIKSAYCNLRNETKQNENL